MTIARGDSNKTRRSRPRAWLSGRPPESDAPAWLAEALSATVPRLSDGALREEAPAEAQPGDICVVRAPDRSAAPARLFLVVDGGSGWCTGMLAGAETELATEVDAVLPTSETGLGYAIVVHTRYLGPIRTAQICRRVGAVTAGTLCALERLAWNDEAAVPLTVGVPLQPDPVDPRYQALRALSAELDALTEPCRQQRWSGK